MRRSPLLAFAVVLLLARHAAATDESPVLHARALLAEAEGAPAAALALLRQAAALAPADAEIAFDRARLAFEHPEARQAGDYDGFLALAPETDDAALLRSYVLLQLGRRDEAALALARAGESEEAQGLARALGGGAGAGGAKALTAVLKVGGQYDSNVTVISDELADLADASLGDALSRQASPRIFAAVDGDWTALRGATTLDVLFGLSYSAHTDRDLADFDSSALEATLRLARPGEQWELYGELGGTHVRAEGVSDPFSSEAALTAGARTKVSRGLHLGGALRGGYRAFHDDVSPSDAPGNRSGPRAEVEGTLDWQEGALQAGARVGFQAELPAEATGQRELGPQATGFFAVRRGALYGLVALAYQMRDYAGEEARLDQRLIPQVRAGWDVNETVGVVAGYALTANLSDESFAYTRHLAQLAAEARW